MDPAKIVEAARQACIESALAAYEDASINGLCHDGAWECAVDAMRTLDVNAILKQVEITSSKRTTSQAIQ